MATILITGFGPFPGVRFNPTGPLAVELARKRHPAFAGVRRLAHVFHVSYEAIDRELPALLEREKPDAMVMFGLAVRSKHVRIEMCAHNTLAPALPDAAGRVPVGTAIVPGGADDRAVARAGAAAPVGSTNSRCACRVVARCRPLSLQLFVLAGGRGRNIRRAASDGLHPCAGPSPDPGPLAPAGPDPG